MFLIFVFDFCDHIIQGCCSWVLSLCFRNASHGEISKFAFGFCYVFLPGVASELGSDVSSAYNFWEICEVLKKKK